MKILKYFDFFGIHFHFYVGNKRKLYTSYGGVISLICIFCCILIFFILTLKELLHKNPISNISSVSQAGNHRVKFGKDKFWIPWRIIDFKKTKIDFNNTLYPSIYIKKGEKDNTENRFTFKSENIIYKLCNETDFVNRGKNYFIDASLDELYCMEFDNIELGGGWTENFLYYVQLDIYICKDGIEYDEGNPKCTTFQELKNKFLNNSWAFEYFYPIVEYQPTNYENPVLVIYKSHFYNFSSYLNKDEKMFFQEYILSDDKGLIFNEDKNSSFWGYISSDFDILSSKGDILNERNSSKLYSLSIFLDAEKKLYMRRYNKIYTVIANVFPIFNLVFYIFDSLTYMVKIIMTEKYLSELFFQRINENDQINIVKDKRKSAGFFYNKYKISLKESNKKVKNNYTNRKETEKERKNYEKNKGNIQTNFSIHSEINNEDFDKNNYFNNSQDKYNEDKNNNNYSSKSNKINKKRKNEDTNISKNSSKDTNTNKSNLEKFNNKLKYIITNRKFSSNNNNSSLNPLNSAKVNNFVEVNMKKSSSRKNEYNKNNPKEISNKLQTLNYDITNVEINNNMENKNDYENNNNFDESEDYKNYSHFNFYKNRGLNNSAIITRFRLKGSLFKMKDYIYSFFIKAVRKDYKYLSKEFGAIFNFLSDVYDISSYLQLYRQFHILSGFLLDNVANIDLNHKININNKELFEQISLKNKNIFYFALKEQFNQISNK